MLCWMMERIAGPDSMLVPRQSLAREPPVMGEGQLDSLRNSIVGIGKQLTAISEKVCLLRDSTDLVATQYFNGEVIGPRATGLVERVRGDH